MSRCILINEEEEGEEEVMYFSRSGDTGEVVREEKGGNGVNLGFKYEILETKN